MCIIENGEAYNHSVNALEIFQGCVHSFWASSFFSLQPTPIKWQGLQSLTNGIRTIYKCTVCNCNELTKQCTVSVF